MDYFSRQLVSRQHIDVPVILLTLSRDRSDPVGYKLSVLPFHNGEPVAAPDNNTAITDILWNADNSLCPQNCFRPVGIAFDDKGRLFMSSDATGEIYVIEKNPSDLMPSSSTSSPASPSPTSGAVKQLEYSIAMIITLALVQFLILH